MNIGALIPIRLASERLPKKALMKIKGKTIVQHLVERAMKSKYLNKENIVICTTQNKEDDELEQEIKRLGVKVFRGSEIDIIDRFKSAIEEYTFDYVIQIFGDDPFSEPLYMDMCMDKLISNSSLDMVCSKGLPLGMNTQAIKASAVLKVWKSHLTEKNDSGYIWYFTKTGLCKIGYIDPITKQHTNDEIRLTLDYIEDFKLFEKIYEHLYSDEEVFCIDEILKLFNQNPEFARTNKFLDEASFKRINEKTNLEYLAENGEVKKID